MVQAFLLLAFYMLGAVRRNAAFMYLGVAARAAFALGLHTSDCDRLMSSRLCGAKYVHSLRSGNQWLIQHQFGALEECRKL